MGRSLLFQLEQIAASATYDDAVGSVHTAGVAEGQSHLEGDQNVFRTMLKAIKGTTNWWDAPIKSIQDLADKFFIQPVHLAGFENVATGTGGSTTAFDTVLKTITNHANGAGGASAEGIVLDVTRAYKLIIRDHLTQDALTDGSNNEIYGRLSYTGGNYVVTWYSYVNGVETAYTFTGSANVDLAYVAVSRKFQDLDWSQFLDFEFHDITGLSGSVTDDNVSVDGMSFLLAGLTTQAGVNLKVDKLGSTAAGEGASGVKISDSSNYYTGTDIETALDELEAQLGGDSSVAYDFGENNVLADNDAVYAALNKLDLKFGDLASAANGEGASLVSIEDAGGFTSQTTVEGALQEIFQSLEDVSGWEKVSETTSGVITSGTSHTIPGSKTFTQATGGLNMDIFFNGQLLLEGAGNDYTEDAGGTSFKPLFDIPSGANLTYMIRK